MTGRRRVLTVVGARPQFVKAAAVQRSIAAANATGADIEEIVVHTGQHYDANMSDVFFDDLGLRSDRNLGIGSGPQGAQTGQMLHALEDVMTEVRPSIVVVYGDTNSTLAGALAAAKLSILVAHVEAGMRSWRRDMPEEVNRVVADHLSALLWCPTQTAVDNLANEGITDGVHLSGDVMHAILRQHLAEARLIDVCSKLAVEPGAYALATVHRAHNTDDPGRRRQIIESLDQLADELPVLFPVHPRGRELFLAGGFRNDVRVIEPLGYREMLSLASQARAIVTDSGGVQKEAIWLGVPCVTLREETEWPETLEGGWNVLAGVEPANVVEAARRPVPRTAPSPALAIDDAPERIVETLRAHLDGMCA